MKAAYADPPYLGCGKSHYGHLHAAAVDYDTPETHQLLIERLSDEFDCWALSLHEPSLRIILPMCPTGVRVASWVKPFAAFRPNVTRAYTWEPVIFKFDGGRKREKTQDTWRDHISAPIAMRKGFPGAKPDAFSHWIFEGLNLQLGDEFCDLFPGSGAVGNAWAKWSARHDFEQFELLHSGNGAFGDAETCAEAMLDGQTGQTPQTRMDASGASGRNRTDTPCGTGF